MPRQGASIGRPSKKEEVSGMMGRICVTCGNGLSLSHRVAVPPGGRHVLEEWEGGTEGGAVLTKDPDPAEARILLPVKEDLVVAEVQLQGVHDRGFPRPRGLQAIVDVRLSVPWLVVSGEGDPLAWVAFILRPCCKPVPLGQEVQGRRDGVQGGTSVPLAHTHPNKQTSRRRRDTTWTTRPLPSLQKIL